jgi:hypothetical protein
MFEQLVNFQTGALPFPHRVNYNWNTYIISYRDGRIMYGEYGRPIED